MHYLKTPLVLALVLVCLLVGQAWGQSFHSVLSELDQNYYYPQTQGLKSFSAKVQWEQLDVASGSGKFLRNPDFIFTWQVDSGEGLGKFSLAERQEEDRFLELVPQINSFSELIIPLTLRQKFSGFEGRVNQVKGDKLMLRLKSMRDSSLSYKILVDSKEGVIRKVRFLQTRSPQNVEGEMSYLKLDGKFAISETRSRFKVNGQDYTEVTLFKYKKVKGIWWVHRIDQTLKQEGSVLQTHIIKLSDFRPIRSAN